MQYYFGRNIVEVDFNEKVVTSKLIDGNTVIASPTFSNNEDAILASLGYRKGMNWRFTWENQVLHFWLCDKLGQTTSPLMFAIANNIPQDNPIYNAERTAVFGLQRFLNTAEDSPTIQVLLKNGLTAESIWYELTRLLGYIPNNCGIMNK